MFGNTKDREAIDPRDRQTYNREGSRAATHRPDLAAQTRSAEVQAQSCGDVHITRHRKTDGVQIIITIDSASRPTTS
jgi:hypothetical protein